MSEIYFDWPDDFRYSSKLDQWVAHAGKGGRIYVLTDDSNLIKTQF